MKRWTKNKLIKYHLKTLNILYIVKKIVLKYNFYFNSMNKIKILNLY